MVSKRWRWYIGHMIYWAIEQRAPKQQTQVYLHDYEESILSQSTAGENS